MCKAVFDKVGRQFLRVRSQDRYPFSSVLLHDPADLIDRLREEREFFSPLDDIHSLSIHLYDDSGQIFEAVSGEFPIKRQMDRLCPVFLLYQSLLNICRKTGLERLRQIPPIFPMSPILVQVCGFPCSRR